MSDQPTFLTAPDGTLAALIPIHAIRSCLKCHGSSSDIPPEIAKTLEELYPDDDATGFESGELHGWFWVEVPRPTAD